MKTRAIDELVLGLDKNPQRYEEYLVQKLAIAIRKDLNDS